MAAEDVTGDPVQALAYKLMALDQRMEAESFEEMWGPDHREGCGGWTWDPPCGGCYDCVMAQTFYAMPGYPSYFALAQELYSRIEGMEPGEQFVVSHEELVLFLNAHKDRAKT